MPAWDGELKERGGGGERHVQYGGEGAGARQCGRMQGMSNDVMGEEDERVDGRAGIASASPPPNQAKVRRPKGSLLLGMKLLLLLLLLR